MSGAILAVDVGTSALKVGVFDRALLPGESAERAYDARIAGDGTAEIDPELWWAALVDALGELRAHLADVEVLSLSVTTPGMTAMDASGAPLAPAILHLDGRAHRQAAALRERIGDDVFLEQTGNVPASGGASIASIMWLREERPEVWAKTAVFGHTNTFVARRLTGRWAVDPSTASLSGMYRTPANDMRWQDSILEAAGIPPAMLPPLVPSHGVVGTVLPAVARRLGLPAGVRVLCGGNDAVLASLAAGLTEPGDVGIAGGTTDIATTCVNTPLTSLAFNLRAHVVPGRWLTFFVLNTGGKALDWFRGVFCREMDAREFYGDFVPRVLAAYLDGDDVEQRERLIPTYVPFLGGSRYDIGPRTAAFDGITLGTTRDDLLISLIRGNITYLESHLVLMRSLMVLRSPTVVSGGGGGIPGMLAARRRWMDSNEVVFREHSSLLGAATLGQWVLDDTA